MVAAVPTAPASSQAARRAYWFPLALFGAIVALAVPLYAPQRDRVPRLATYARSSR